MRSASVSGTERQRSCEGDALTQQKSAMFDPGLVIDPQDVDRRSTNGARPFHRRPVPTEMAVPVVDPRVKQAAELAGRRIVAGNVRRFERVAQGTGPRQIGERRRAVMFERFDVIDFVR